MDQKYILAIDQGTTSSRAMLFDRSGEVVAKDQLEFLQIFPHPGWVEHDPEEILSSVLQTISNVLDQSAINPLDIAAIGLTNQRETTVVWEKETGRPVYNAIVWQSRQSAEVCEELASHGRSALVRERTGLLIDAYFSGTKIRWILDHVDRGQARAERGELLFGTIDSWLIWNLTGRGLHMTDISNAARTMLFNIHTRCWDAQLLGILDVPASMLPEVRSSSEVYGHTVSLRGLPAGIPISGVAGDQQAALFGQACFEPGMAKNTYGTGCFMLMNTGTEPILSRHGLLTTIAWQIDGVVEYALEGSIFVAGSVVQWLRDSLSMIERASDSQACAERLESSDGTYFVPAFVGLGAPYWQSDVRGAIFGLSHRTSKDHLVRAALESIAYQSRDVLAAMEADSGIPLKELRVDGGAIANDFLAQFQSDILGVPVMRQQMTDMTARGAAYLAGLAVGFWESRGQLSALSPTNPCLTPAMDEATREKLYAGWKRAVHACMGYRVDCSQSGEK